MGHWNKKRVKLQKVLKRTVQQNTNNINENIYYTINIFYRDRKVNIITISTEISLNKRKNLLTVNFLYIDLSHPDTGSWKLYVCVVDS